ncbi:Cell division protein ZapA [wastewater metagenome]|uniref:Cell division protein ZapA n=2 Tax=unclassified sequences TaxID=12908 RepID=A0A5B8RC11_9ZZZZ|nr:MULTISPECIES: cell division protein ZapA [Arhodomonas]MCS4502955.1 cell division protein ZapA [Arhodomonas aquaeolei]QEA06186.1 cell division protein ZapA [uncultured organism]
MSEEPVAVRILEREYMVSCSPGERESLREAAAFLDARMREIRDGGRIVGQDRIAVMAALNIASDFLEQGRRLNDQDLAAQAIQRLSSRIGSVLEDDAPAATHDDPSSAG